MSSERQEASGKPILELSVSAYHFDQEIFDSAIEALHPHFQVGGGLLLEFSDVPPANVTLDVVLQAMSPISLGLISAAIYDVLKRFFLWPRKTEETSFSFHMRDNSRSVDLHLKTSDSEVLHSALDKIPTLDWGKPEGNAFKFDAQDREWKSDYQGGISRSELRTLAIGLGPAPLSTSGTGARACSTDLDYLAGTWPPAEAAAFDQALKSMRHLAS